MPNYPTDTDNPAEATTYNGWANYETWNVSLYINNEYALYKSAYNYAAHCIKLGRDVSYKNFISDFMFGAEDVPGFCSTPDGVSYDHPDLNHDELDEMMRELVD